MTFSPKTLFSSRGRSKKACGKKWGMHVISEAGDGEGKSQSLLSDFVCGIMWALARTEFAHILTPSMADFNIRFLGTTTPPKLAPSSQPLFSCIRATPLSKHDITSGLFFTISLPPTPFRDSGHHRKVRSKKSTRRPICEIVEKIAARSDHPSYSRLRAVAMQTASFSVSTKGTKKLHRGFGESTERGEWP